MLPRAACHRLHQHKRSGEDPFVTTILATWKHSALPPAATALESICHSPRYCPRAGGAAGETFSLLQRGGPPAVNTEPVKAENHPLLPALTRDFFKTI